MDSCTSRSTSSVFQSTLLMRGATCPSTNLVRTKPKFQSTLLMRGATSRLLPLSSASAISIHAPHARSDMTLLSNQLARPLFQSTLLMRGATHHRQYRCMPSFYFNPRSSCEERLRRATSSALPSNFNPRSSCEERRSTRSRQSTSQLTFQSTLLMRGATSRIASAFASGIFQSTLLMRGATCL